MQIRLSGPLEHDNIVNGYGLRAVLWTQGCARRCLGCQNPETWDFNGGFLVDVDEIKERLHSFKGQSGITFCGGEPFEQPVKKLPIGVARSSAGMSGVLADTLMNSYRNLEVRNGNF